MVNKKKLFLITKVLLFSAFVSSSVLFFISAKKEETQRESVEILEKNYNIGKSKEKKNPQLARKHSPTLEEEEEFLIENKTQLQRFIIIKYAFLFFSVLSLSLFVFYQFFAKRNKTSAELKS